MAEGVAHKSRPILQRRVDIAFGPKRSAQNNLTWFVDAAEYATLVQHQRLSIRKGSADGVCNRRVVDGDYIKTLRHGCFRWPMEVAYSSCLRKRAPPPIDQRTEEWFAGKEYPT